ncbi:MOZ/SAS family protein [Dictyocaulus viviparus]|uniref:Histone acetyltransferase n=1 Tax=Dictyocaulus viviparus TaxID=29172 RepID=A0A0D8XYG2_DICVI|nr:MOZ/SAS family protein [Dictyocaulus viviparus]
MAVLDTESVLIGEIYLVRGRRGCWRSATVLDKRVIKNGGVEFYMHFDGDDRRLDHWVASSRLKITEVKYIEVVRYGEFEIDTWYVSPYPDEYEKDKYLFICDRCFLYMRQERTYKIHLSTCNTKHPPGKEIYQDNVENIIVYEVDGEREKLYSQCLCLFAKLFMDHKAIYFDVSGFLFYVICEWNESGYLRAVGYFSKERVSSDGHNLNCILVFPPFQRHGYGSFLIQLSYELSRRQGVLGSPEKPLSDLGLLSYRHFWAYMIVDHLSSLMDMSWIRVTELANELGMQIDDVITTLEWLQLYEPSTVSETPKDTEPWVLIHLKTLDKLRKLVARPPRLMMNARLLHWRPCV